MQTAINTLLELFETKLALGMLITALCLSALWLFGDWSLDVYAILGLLSITTSCAAMAFAIFDRD